MTALNDKLESLGLSQYLESFLAEGFDTWETVLDITESDLSSLNVKLGHRRKLQRAIAVTREQQSREHGVPADRGPGSADYDLYKSDESASETRSVRKSAYVNSQAAPSGSTKRKYRRHPKPDENAPERPPSAYVIFSNHMREKLKMQELSFTEMAKVVGEQWQVLEPEEKAKCERQAASAKERYLAELTEYKKTPEYAQYQEYLADFKAKHAVPSNEGKRSRVETETSISNRSSGQDVAERSGARRVSSGLLDGAPKGPQRSGSTPPAGAFPWHSGRPAASKPTSPATYSFSGINSPIARDRHSPATASPASTTVLKTPPIDLSYLSGTSSAPPEPAERQPDTSFPGHAPIPIHPPLAQSNKSLSGRSPPAAFGLPTHTLDFSSRRPTRTSPGLPPLVHEETTLSSDNGSYSGVPYQGTMQPPLDMSSKPHAHRMLLQPLPSTGPSPSPSHFDQRLPILPPLTGQPQSPDFRLGSSMAALLRAGELARDADDGDMRDKHTPP